VRTGRLGDKRIEVPRPGRKAAAAILGKYLKPELPYSLEEGHDKAAAREKLIDAAVSHVFSRQGVGELAVLVFRDGRRRSLLASDLVSGARLRGIAQAAKKRAFLRHLSGSDGGIHPDDLKRAVVEEFADAARAITPRNCQRYIEGLPDDIDVVRVERNQRKQLNPYRYISSRAA